MPISIDNTNYVNKDYGRTGQSESVPVRDNSYRSSGQEALTSGTTVTGQIVEKDGDQVTIRLDNDRTISAKLQGNADIEVGMKLTFEVAKGENNQTALRPLFSNLANNNAAMAALKAAGLPVNNTTMAMTDKMMSENMPVNRNALSQMFRNVSTHSNVSPESIVQMTKLNMPLTESNVIQFDNYRNFEHRITNDLANVSEAVSELFKEAVADATGEGSGVATQAFGSLSSNEVINEILDLIDTDSLETIMPENETTAAQNATVAEAPADNPLADKAMTDMAADNTTAANPSVTDQSESASVQTTASVIRNTVDGLLTDIKEMFTSRPDTETQLAVNTNLSLSPSEQQLIGNELQDILILAGKASDIREPLDPSEIMKAVKELVAEYPPEVTRIDESELVAYSEEYDEGLDEVGRQNAAENDISALRNRAGNESAPADDRVILRDDETAKETANTKGTEAARNNPVNETVLKMKDQIDANTENVKARISEKLNSLLKSDGFSKLLKDSVKAQMSIKPADVSQNGKIEELYERIQKTSSRISQLMENIGRADSAPAQSAAALNDNVNFMNQLNEFVNYIQLPLKMAGEDANGELYVYTNKKNLADNDGNYSALLHLDMEHLGPMDVYVTMRDHTKVNTNFYLESEELLDFMEAHIDMLTERLAQKGYVTNTRVTQKEKGKPITPITDEFTKDEARADTQVVVSRMRFDVRA